MRLPLVLKELRKKAVQEIARVEVQNLIRQRLRQIRLLAVFVASRETSENPIVLLGEAIRSSF